MSYLKIFAATIEVFFFGALVSGWSNIGILLRGQFYLYFFAPTLRVRPGVMLEHVKVKLCSMVAIFSIS